MKTSPVPLPRRSWRQYHARTKGLRWWFDDVDLAMAAEGVVQAEGEAQGGWMSEAALFATHPLRKEDLTDLAKRGIIETMTNPKGLRLYRLARR